MSAVRPRTLAIASEVLGLRQADLSLSDVLEEINDVSHDICVLEECERGALPLSEAKRLTCFQTTDLDLLREGLLVLRAWRKQHLVTT